MQPYVWVLLLYWRPFWRWWSSLFLSEIMVALQHGTRTFIIISSEVRLQCMLSAFLTLIHLPLCDCTHEARAAAHGPHVDRSSADLFHKQPTSGFTALWRYLSTFIHTF